MCRLFKGIIVLGLIFAMAGCSEASGPAKIKALILTGQNNHNWEVNHAVLKQILENSGMFDVDIALSPEKGGDMSGYKPAFTDYDVIVLDYNGDRWPDETDRAFIDYVRKGGGVVVFHAGDNAFPEWEEYNKVTALGGWNKRNEENGPYVWLEDGKLVYDSLTPGVGGAHGPAHEFQLVKVAGHPVTDGLPDVWMHAKDELYDKMRGPGNIKDVLYAAYSSPEQKGTDRYEILLFTVDYHQGRIFHTMLGHAGKTAEESLSLQCAGFQTTLLRGAEWAATGNVTQPVPSDFPGPDKVSLRPDFKIPD